ncbi:TDT family transporter [Bacillus fonticola]|uniref:hypothetical protein n=1 Tax=Bacillus fonticola TaxID=2728853 RepID=UPI0014762C2A|nr:hypothetical protein [Bacillus fonticola]
MIILVPFIAFVLFFVQKRYFPNVLVDTSSAAAVMAGGIFINGALTQIAYLNLIEDFLALLLSICWFYLAYVFVHSAVTKQFSIKHLQAPLQVFGIGTWVAATSVFCIVQYLHYPSARSWTFVLAVGNFFLWLVYLYLIMVRIKQFVVRKHYRNVHGIILLTTVSTQSIVIMNAVVFPERIPTSLQIGLFSLGILFYIGGVVLIVKRYIRDRGWSLADDWKNTNCIVHGAVSISGVAGIKSGILSMDVAFWFWIWALTFFIIVEVIEIVRAHKRIRLYGLQEGIGRYHVSQWSRNFTIGMFLFFTITLDMTQIQHHIGWFYETVQRDFLIVGPWLVLGLLTIECILFLKGNLDQLLESSGTQFQKSKGL